MWRKRLLDGDQVILYTIHSQSSDYWEHLSKIGMKSFVVWEVYSHWNLGNNLEKVRPGDTKQI